MKHEITIKFRLDHNEISIPCTDGKKYEISANGWSQILQELFGKRMALISYMPDKYSVSVRAIRPKRIKIYRRK
jgi:hypothetical protein